MTLLQQNHVKYGLIMCAIIAGCLLLMELTGQNQAFDMKSPFQTFFMMIAPFIVWYLGIRARKNIQRGKLTFKEGVMEGFKISLVYALTSPFIFLLYYVLINPAIIPWIKEAYGMQSAPDAGVIAVDMTAQCIAATLFGTLYAAIISFFLKSKS